MKKKRIYDVDNEPELVKKEKRHKVIKWFVIICILIITGCILWARFISTRGLRVKEYAVISENIIQEYDGFKIAHFTDLHYGSTIRIKELKKIVHEINKQKPDIVVFTGDLTEPRAKISKKEIKQVIEVLNKIDPTIETLAVIGNHDYDTDYWKKIVPNLNWTVLDNTYHYVYKDSNTPIVFVGIDDKDMGKPDYENAFSFTNENDQDLYTVVLVHEPDQVLDMKNYNYDLVLSGHSHLGQVRLPLFGAIYVPRGSKTYYDEHYKLDKADLYISGGLGTNTLKLRFFNKPSFNLYRFYTK